MDFPQRKRNRLPDYDYSENGAYFITICTEGKKCRLSVIRLIQTETQITLTREGQIVERFVREIPKKYPAVSVDHYVIMPNHVHLLLRIERNGGTGNPSPTAALGTGNPSPTAVRGTGDPSPTAVLGTGTGFASPAPTVGNVVGWFKYQTTKAINEAEKEKISFWQRSYYDHVIRDQNDYLVRWNYIDGNPPRWAEDEYYKGED